MSASHSRSKKTPTAVPVAPTPVALHPAVAAATVFLASGAVLVLEILAVRLLAPYVGLTMETTTSIIGAVLAGIALGAAVGGIFADRTDPRRLVVGLLIAGGMLALLTVPIVRALGPGAGGHGNLAALGVTLASLVPSAAVLSAISPTVARLQLRDLGASGTIVGRLSAFATAGALVGTFGTGFVLVPLMPVSTAVLGIGLVLALAGLGLGGYFRALGRPALAAILVAVIGLALLSGTRDSPCDVDTNYHCASVAIAADGPPEGRVLVLDGVDNSLVDLADRKDLVYSYSLRIAQAFQEVSPAPRPVDAIVVGGGAFTLPQWLLATRPGSHVKVLEVDKKLVEFDKQHFGLRTSPNLEAVVGDARVSMRAIPSGRADLVIGDAFTGYAVPWQLLTREFVKDVKRVMKPGGLYAVNLIDFGKHDLMRAELATLREQFADVQMVALTDDDGNVAGGNQVVFASDTRRAWEGFTPEAGLGQLYNAAAAGKLAEGGKLLRDDYAPVDQLFTPPPASLRKTQTQAG
jgi:spermidine synthase